MTQKYVLLFSIENIFVYFHDPNKCAMDEGLIRALKGTVLFKSLENNWLDIIHANKDLWMDSSTTIV